jgi:hypothetical protein
VAELTRFGDRGFYRDWCYTYTLFTVTVFMVMMVTVFMVMMVIIMVRCYSDTFV